MSVSRRLTRQDITVETARARQTFERVRAIRMASAGTSRRAGSEDHCTVDDLEPGSAEMAERVAELLRDAVRDPGLAGMEIVELEDDDGPLAVAVESSPGHTERRTGGGWSLATPQLSLSERAEAVLRATEDQLEPEHSERAQTEPAADAGAGRDEGGEVAETVPDILALYGFAARPAAAGHDGAADDDDGADEDADNAGLNDAVLRARAVLEEPAAQDSSSDSDAHDSSSDGGAFEAEAARLLDADTEDFHGAPAAAAVSAVAVLAGEGVEVVQEADEPAERVVDTYQEADDAFMDDLRRRAEVLGVRLHM
jgi:hypothetical protein